MAFDTRWNVLFSNSCLQMGLGYFIDLMIMTVITGVLNIIAPMACIASQLHPLILQPMIQREGMLPQGSWAPCLAGVAISTL